MTFKEYTLWQDTGSNAVDWHDLNNVAGYRLPYRTVNYFEENDIINQYEIIFGDKNIVHRIVHTHLWNPSPELHDALLKEGFNETS